LIFRFVAANGSEPAAASAELRDRWEHVCRLAKQDLERAIELGEECGVNAPLAASSRDGFSRSLKS
jgi:hypothetical protein